MVMLQLTLAELILNEVVLVLLLNIFQLSVEIRGLKMMHPSLCELLKLVMDLIIIDL